MGHYGAILGHRRATWEPFWGQCGAFLGPSWSHLGATLGHLGTILGHMACKSVEVKARQGQKYETVENI